jgi:hypothetical protein
MRFDLADDEIDALRAHLVALSDVAHRESGRPALVVLMPAAPTPAADRLLYGLQHCPSAGGDMPTRRVLPALRVIRYTTLAEVDPQLVEMARNGSAAALFAPYLIGAEDDFSRSALRSLLPTVLPMSMRDLGDDAQIVFALPGLQAQAQALIDAPAGPSANRLVIVIDRDMPSRAVLSQRLQAFAERAGWRVRHHDNVDAALASDPLDALLALADLPMPPSDLPTNIRLWVPAAYAVPQQMQAWAQRGATVRMALPYAPTLDGEARWIPPADAWVAIGCELIARLPPLPQDRDDVSAWRRTLSSQPALRLGDWLRLPPTSPVDDAASRVFLSAWPPAER